MTDAKKPFPWGKILKLFFEFAVAVVTAIFASSCVHWIR